MKQELQRANSQADLCIKSMIENAEKRLNQGEDLVRQSLSMQEGRFQSRLERVKSKKLIR